MIVTHKRNRRLSDNAKNEICIFLCYPLSVKPKINFYLLSFGIKWKSFLDKTFFSWKIADKENANYFLLQIPHIKLLRLSTTVSPYRRRGCCAHTLSTQTKWKKKSKLPFGRKPFLLCHFPVLFWYLALLLHAIDKVCDMTFYTRRNTKRQQQQHEWQ